MNPFSYAAAAATVVYLYCAFRVYRLDPRASVNRVAAVLNLNFALWAFASVFCYADLDLSVASFWYRSFAFCWNFFASILLHFALRATGIRPPAGRAGRLAELAALYLPSVFFSIGTNAFMVTGFEFRGGFWFPVYDDPRWLLAYSAYYILYCLASIAVLARGRARATGGAERKRLNFLILAISVALAGGFVTDTVFLLLSVDFPNIAILWILVWATGMLAAMSRYSFLSPFPVHEAARIVDGMADVFLYLDEAGTVVWANASALARSGEPSLAVLRGRRFAALCRAVGDDGARFEAVLSGLSRECAAPIQYGPERTPLFARLTALSDAEGPGGFILAGSDQTEERRRTRAEGLLDSFVSHSLEGIVVTDGTGRIARWNEAVETITGIPEAAAREMSVWDALVSLQRDDQQSRANIAYTASSLRDAFAGEGPVWTKRSRELPIRDRRGRDRIVQISSFFLPSSGGQVFAAIARDVTEERRAAAETVERIRRLDHAQKMEAIGTLSGGLAHDFNNALGGIVGAVSLMRLNLADGSYGRIDDINGEVDIIARAAERASRTVRRLLSLTKKRDHESVPVRLDDVVQRVVDVAERSVDSSVRIVLERAAGEARVLGDAAQIEQLVLNLVINAAHAMTLMRRPGERRGGEARVALSRAVPDEALRAINPAAENRCYWLVSVRDEGVGITNDIRSKIFDPFFTTKGPDEGSGLGLSMVDSIARQHGGFVELDSEPGRGTEFRVYLPELEGGGAPVGAGEDSVSRGSGLVLVAEDEETLRGAETAMLKALGYRAAAHPDGRAAAAAFAEAPGAYAAALLDMNMPGMRGDEAFASIRSLRQGLPVVIASGYAEDEAVAALLRQESVVFLPKPFTIEELGAALSRVMGRERVD